MTMTRRNTEDYNGFIPWDLASHLWITCIVIHKLSSTATLFAANVRAQFGKATYDFQVVTLQAAALLAFNEATGMTSVTPLTQLC